MSRFRIFVLLAALAALTVAFAACGSSDNSSEDPQTVIDNATLEGVKSGKLDVSLDIASEGKDGGDIDASLSGPFQSEDSNDLPQLALTASAKGSSEGEKIDFEGGLTLLSDRAFVNYEGTEYEVDVTTFAFVKSSIEQAQKQGPEGNAADVSACQEAASGLEIGEFAENLTNKGSADVDGTTTTKISGKLNVPRATDAIIELAEDPACSTQLEAAGSVSLDELEEARDELDGAVKKADVSLYVGDDDIVRKVEAELTIEPKGSSKEKVEVDFELTLSGVNEEQEISAPANAKPLEGLLQKLDVNPTELLEAGSSGEGLGDLLEEIIKGGSSGGGSSPEGSSGGSGGGVPNKQAYLECLKTVKSAAELQKCASLAP